MYLHKLDNFITKEFIPAYSRDKHRRENSMYTKRYMLDNIEKEIVKKHPSIKTALLRVKYNQFVLSNDPTAKATDHLDKNCMKLHYIHYADDFLLEFIELRKIALEIMEKVSEKIENLKLKINKDKSDVVHSNSKNIKFLGVYIRYFKHNKIKKKIDESETDDITKQINKLISQSVTSTQFRAPIDKITIRLAEKN